MLDLGDKKLCDLCFEEVINEACVSCDGISNLSRYTTALKEGTVLAGKYAVGRVLGKGGFGVTYLCFNLENGEKVAIKEYFPDSLVSRNTGETVVNLISEDKREAFEEGARKFYEEAQTVSKFKTAPNVIHVNEFFYENKTAYFVMEYLEGIDLKSYIRKNGGSLDASEAVSITSKVVDALSVVHAEGVLHRDIAPDNIFICKNGDVKLIDFGAARFVLGEASKSLSVILKQGFAPPEQYHRKGNQGPWTDIYALGATLYFALTGKIIDDVMSRMEDDTLDMAGIPKELQPIIVKMLAVKYVERYQNTAELKAVFGKFKSSPIIPAAPALPKEEKNEKPTQKPAIPTANPPTATPENKKKKLLPLLIASLFLVVIVAVAAVFVLKGQDNDEVSVPVQGNVTLDNSPTPYNPIVEINPEEPSEAPENEPEADEPIENEPEEPTEQENPTEEPEEPKTEPESIEPPKAEEPKVEEPKVEEPKTDTPKEETPKEETKVEKPKEEAKIEPMGLKLSHTSVTLTEGESVTITATVEPSNATNKTVGWTSYNESVASVKNGVITAHKAGTTVITASVGTINVTCNVTVKAKNVAVTDITLDKTSVTLTEGETTTIKATVTPDNATDKTVTWSTSNELVASIENGVITAENAGTATITATSGGKSATCIVTVKPEIIAEEPKDVEPKVEEPKVVLPTSVKVGDYIKFGRYEQDNNTSNGKEEIEWRVLEVKDGRALVISKYGLDAKAYNEKWEDVAWETCMLRRWLNNEFLNTAFTSDEKAMIPTVTVTADKNPEYSTNPGNATQDKVFLLSINEANKYFSSSADMICKPTDYAVANGVSEDYMGNCCWWLRSPGYSQRYAAGVDYGGSVGTYGVRVNRGGLVSTGGTIFHHGYYAVRPALWINLES
ncbi:MAG: hypothetical protein E7613_00155 [Ruminococcaceae bacterium]|nr:hypothetical protein [Oscillospiraceae bacterium]